ncbi:unnamed protein product [Ectocarpus sp. CCAP 1310/34]|nr:unnamed protein product [Ectocarpus sp. CCAP 1310/34]
MKPLKSEIFHLHEVSRKLSCLKICFLKPENVEPQSETVYFLQNSVKFNLSNT